MSRHVEQHPGQISSVPQHVPSPTHEPDKNSQIFHVTN